MFFGLFIKEEYTGGVDETEEGEILWYRLAWLQSCIVWLYSFLFTNSGMFWEGKRPFVNLIEYFSG